MAHASPYEPRMVTLQAMAAPQSPPGAGGYDALQCEMLAHRHTREALRQSETQYHDLVAGSLQGIGMLHLDGIIQWVNATMATLFGYASPDALCGQDIRTLLATHEHERWEGFRRACAQDVQAPQRHTIEGVHRDGHAVWIDLLVSPTSWQGVPALLVTCLDVTERQGLEKQVRQRHKIHALGTLAGGIAHDFNNMLAAILGYTELLMDEVPRESPAWPRLQRILTAGERAKELVRQILTVSRQEEQERRPVQLCLLIDEVLRLLRASLPVTVAIQQHCEPHVGTVLADPIQMYQVLMNLCINAEHAMRATGGVLEVGLKEISVTEPTPASFGTLMPGPYVCLTVRDTGHGIPPEVRERIFEPFFTTKAPEEGTGMGLTVVRGIVRNHDGAIMVTSLPGQGTTFALYFPRFHRPGETPAPSEEPVPGGTERILFVDDEEPIARLGCMMLERLGYTVVVSTSGSEALALFRATPQSFDLVITDHTMPAMTGARLAQELRRLRPDLPVILCSGFSHTMNADKAQALGLDAFLLKPFLHRDLGIMVRRVLERRQTSGL